MLLITKFNRMIRSRLLWGFFAVIVSASFVLVGFAAKSGRDGPDRRKAVAGTVFGQEVATREFDLARYFAMGMRERGDGSDEDTARWDTLTWRRLAMLRAADDLGLTPSDREMTSIIGSDPSFAENGVFSRAKYRAIAERQFRVNEQLFDMYLRQEVALRRVTDLLQTAAWTSPYELNKKLSDFSDSFALQYTVVGRTNYPAEADVSLEYAQSFFDENREMFRMPEMVNVRYAAFPISNHLAKVRVMPAEISQYYDEHLQDYTTSSTNEPFLPLASVSNDILGKISFEKATFEAKDMATEFVVALTPDRSGKALDMSRVAAAYSLTVRTSDFFTVTGVVPELDVGPEFNRAAFELDPGDPEAYFSDAIVGADNVYVIATHEKREARYPFFHEVTNGVMPLAREQAATEAFLEGAGKIRGELAEDLAVGKTFREACEARALNVSTTQPFSVHASVSGDIPYADVLIAEIVNMDKGDLSDVLEVRDGGLVAYVAEREGGDLVSAELLKPQVLSTLDRYRAAFMSEGWSDFVLARSGYEPAETPAAPVEPEPEDEPADE